MLKEIQDIDQSWKLVFIAACHSEAIGRIFHRLGAPVVIAVNSENQVQDKAAKVFSTELYTQLLNGFSIKKSVAMAKKQLMEGSESNDFVTCCCAHDHKDDCLWYEYFKEDP